MIVQPAVSGWGGASGSELWTVGNNGPGPCQSKVTYLEIAVGVQQQVAGLQIAMQHVGGVDVFEAAQELGAGVANE